MGTGRDGQLPTAPTRGLHWGHGGLLGGPGWGWERQTGDSRVGRWQRWGRRSWAELRLQMRFLFLSFYYLFLFLFLFLIFFSKGFAVNQPKLPPEHLFCATVGDTSWRTPPVHLSITPA